MGRSFLKVISKECDPSLATDRSLPYTSYLIEYLQDDITKFDIVTGDKQSEIFDHYWDLYKKDFVNMTQTEGRKNPRLWTDPNEPKKEKRK
jgi:hypothetical protein